MMTEIKKLPKSQAEITLETPWEDWKKYLDIAASEASREIKISGFRPGKAPRDLVEKKVGKEIILSNAAEKAVRKKYVDFAVSEKLEAIGSPKVEILEMEEGKPLKFKATVSLMPEIEIDPTYKEAVKKINADFKEKKSDVGEDEIDLELEKLASSRVKLVTVLREAKNGDSVVVDFEVLIGGVPIENGKSQDHPLVLGKGVFIPGFEENIVGMKEGENKEFELSFPESYHKKDLAGKKALFKVKVKLVQERQTPEINDDFAKSLGKFESLENLKKNVREGLEHERVHKLQEEKRNAQIEKIVEKSKADLPEILIEEEVKKMILELENQLSPMGMDIETYLKNIGKKKEDLERDWKPQAQKRVISALALKKIVREEKIEIDSKDIEAEMNKTLQYYKNVKDIEKNIDMERLYGYSKGVLENEKVFEMLEKL